MSNYQDVDDLNNAKSEDNQLKSNSDLQFKSRSTPELNVITPSQQNSEYSKNKTSVCKSSKKKDINSKLYKSQNNINELNFKLTNNNNNNKKFFNVSIE